MGRDIRICALCAFVSFAAMAVHAAASTFTATTDQDNNGYTGTVSSGGDGYAFTPEDSARYYKFLNLYNDLLLDGEACAGRVLSFSYQENSFSTQLL